MDTTAIIEALRAGAWKPLGHNYQLETVEKCLEELRTGRNAPDIVTAGIVEKTFVTIHTVTPTQRAALALRPGPVLDDGERDLWAHAVDRQDSWMLCGPDRASMRWGYENGFRDKLTSLGQLLADIGHRTNPPLKPHHDQAWLNEVMRKLTLGIL